MNTTSRINQFGNCAIVVAGDNDRIAIRIDPADDANMTAATTAHHGDRSNLRSRDPRAICEIAAAAVTSPLEDHVHE